jgi:hypothetical protein
MSRKPIQLDLSDPDVCVRLLEGSFDRAAAAFVIGGRLLSAASEGGFDDAINALEKDHKDAFEGLETILKAVPDELFKPTENFVYEAIHTRTATAYLFGPAVGRRLSPRPLGRGKGGAR